MADFTVLSEKTDLGPRQFDFDRCIHCGLCLNACPTYRAFGPEMDSPRGRIYQMVQVAEARRSVILPEHIGRCLGCRGCQSACPSAVVMGNGRPCARLNNSGSPPPMVGAGCACSCTQPAAIAVGLRWRARFVALLGQRP